MYTHSTFMYMLGNSLGELYFYRHTRRLERLALGTVSATPSSLLAPTVSPIGDLGRFSSSPFVTSSERSVEYRVGSIRVE
jgi:hypothetical protein